MNKTTDKNVLRGIVEARRITRRWAKSFYFASFFLSREKRYASYAVYAICRQCDHTVDNTTDSAKAQNLSDIKEKIEAAYGDAPLGQNLLLAFRETVKKYQIPKQYFDNLIDGMYMDLQKSRYENFDELYTYCYKVAGVVGLIMLRILGHDKPEAEKYAVDLGVAMQLTNILRDVKEDYSLGRIYLPKDEMQRNGLTEDAIAQEQLDKNFEDFLKTQIARAREFYISAAKGIPMITGARCRFVVSVMKEIYSGILISIEHNGYDIFARRAYVSRIKKIFLSFKILLKGQYLKRY